MYDTYLLNYLLISTLGGSTKTINMQNNAESRPGYLGHRDAARPTFSAHAAQPTGSAVESRHLG